jgi:hypothetical protein
MKQIKFYGVIILLLVVLIVPSFASAAWWNPFSWNIFKIFFQPRTNTAQQITNKPNPSPTPTVSPAPVSTLPAADTSNWKTYKNDKYGFQFKYPESFSVKESPNSTHVDIYCNTVMACNNFSATITKTTLPLNQYVKGTLESVHLPSTIVSPYILGNMPGYLVTSVQSADPNLPTYTEYFMKNGDNILEIGYEYSAVFLKDLSDPKVAYHLQNVKDKIPAALKAHEQAQALISTFSSVVASSQNNQPAVNPPITISDLPNFSDITAKKDFSSCKKLDNLVMVDSCYRTIATVSNDAKICELIQDRTPQGNYNSCYSEIAKKLKDDSYCAYIKGSDPINMADQCYSTLAIFKNDVSPCKKIKNIMEEDICISSMARIKKDPSLCNILPDITPQQECYQAPGSSHVGCPGANNKDSIRTLCISSTPKQLSATITSPNGGEIWNIGEIHNITWQPIGTDNVSIYAASRADGKMYVVAGPLAVSSGSYSWTVGSLDGGYKMPAGQYEIQIVDANNSMNTLDSSNSYFSVVAP